MGLWTESENNRKDQAKLNATAKGPMTAAGGGQHMSMSP